MLGRRITFVRLACNSLLLYVECEPGDGQGWMTWVEPVRHCLTATAIVEATGTKPIMTEIIFLVEEAPEGGMTACALGESIFTAANSIEELRENVRRAVACHYDESEAPKVIRLHFVRQEVLTM